MFKNAWFQIHWFIGITVGLVSAIAAQHPGLFAYMIASLAMPLFAMTGWMLYLDRRKKKRAARAAESAAVPASSLPGIAANGADSLLLGFASQAGFAWQTAGSLQAAGFNVDVQPLARVGHEQLQARRALQKRSRG